MSDFTKNEEENWQREVRGKVQDLSDSVKHKWFSWGPWELEFIESMAEKLRYDVMNVTPKQYEKVWDLWEKL